jgi:hypothetical protein
MRQADKLTLKLRRKLEALAVNSISVGIPKEESSQKDGKTLYLADIANKNNFGSYSQNIPARPFGTTTIPRYKPQIQKIIQIQINDILEKGKDVKKGFDAIGVVCAGFMKKNLTDGEWTPNAQSTIDLKGSDQPLIDKGQMRQSITWRVHEGNA